MENIEEMLNEINLHIFFLPMYIDFDEYPRYSGRNYEFFQKMLMKIFSVSMVMHILCSNKKYAHGLMRNVG